MNKKLLTITLLILLILELTLLLNTQLGFILYAIIVLGTLIGLTALEDLRKYSIDTKLITFLMIIPIVRMAEIFSNFDSIFRIAVVYLSLFFLVAFYLLKFKVNIGFTLKGIKFLPIALVVGIALGFIGNLFFNLEKNLFLFSLIAIISYSEEVFFRGLVQNTVREGYGIIWSLIVPSVLVFIFTLSLGILPAIFFFFVSLVTSTIYSWNKNIFIALIINLLVSVIMFAL